jgi:hypothetical protein
MDSSSAAIAGVGTKNQAMINADEANLGILTPPVHATEKEAIKFLLNGRRESLALASKSFHLDGIRPRHCAQS